MLFYSCGGLHKKFIQFLPFFGLINARRWCDGISWLLWFFFHSLISSSFFPCQIEWRSSAKMFWGEGKHSQWAETTSYRPSSPSVLPSVAVEWTTIVLYKLKFQSNEGTERSLCRSRQTRVVLISGYVSIVLGCCSLGGRGKSKQKQTFKSLSKTFLIEISWLFGIF